MKHPKLCRLSAAIMPASFDQMMNQQFSRRASTLRTPTAKKESGSSALPPAPPAAPARVPAYAYAVSHPPTMADTADNFELDVTDGCAEPRASRRRTRSPSRGVFARRPGQTVREYSEMMETAFAAPLIARRLTYDDNDGSTQDVGAEGRPELCPRVEKQE